MSKTRSESKNNQIAEHIPGVWEDALDLWDENGMLLAKVLKRGDAKSRHAMLNAAPDMLGALKQLLLSVAITESLGEPMGPNHENVVAARLAIAKAEGK